MTTTTMSKVFGLDDLAAMTCDQLETLYRDGGLPSDFATISGKPKGRMLAIRHTDQTPVFDVVRLLASLGVFPWDGKTFKATGKLQGEGINRVKLLMPMIDLFRFETRIENSKLDGQPTVILDYEQPGNPWFVAKIHDEIREVSPGVYLGPAMWKTKAGASTVLWFAVDFNRQS